jgi:hypothetical protein
MEGERRQEQEKEYEERKRKGRICDRIGGRREITRRRI